MFPTHAVVHSSLSVRYQEQFAENARITVVSNFRNRTNIHRDSISNSVVIPPSPPPSRKGNLEARNMFDFSNLCVQLLYARHTYNASK